MLGAVVEVSVLAVLHARQDLLLRGIIAFQLVGDEDPWGILASFEELAEKLLRGLRVAAALHQHIQPVAVLIDGPPEVVPSPMDGEKHLVQLPFVPWSGTPAPKWLGILRPKRAVPLADGLIGHRDPTRKEPLCHIAITEAKPEIEPHGVADDLGGEAVVPIAVGR
jgi:hypothetical protein